MAISIKHPFTSAKADGPDTTLVQPSNWNADHAITMAAGTVLGKDTSGAGAAQELPIAVDSSGNTAIVSTGWLKVPIGTTAERPATPTAGMIRFNTTNARFEGYTGTSWGNIGQVPIDQQPIINGNFRVWQRSLSSSIFGYNTADRWFNNYSGGTTTQASGNFAAGDFFGRNNPLYYLRRTVTGQTTISHYSTMQQRIEGVRSFSGRTVSVLGWARTISGSGTLVIDMIQNFGTGGSPSSTVAIAPVTLTIGATWTPFAAVFSVPSITGKTFGTNFNDHLEVSFWQSGGSDWNSRTNSIGLQTSTMDFWGLHIRDGVYDANSVSLYVEPELTGEIARCQRYYTTGRMFMQGNMASAGNMGTGTGLPTRMRTVPTVTVATSSQTGLTAGPFVQNVTNISVGFNATFSAGGGAFAFVDFTADAEL